MHRRRFLRTSTCGLALGALGTQREVFAGRPSTPAARPKPPYRVWFQPRCFHRDVDLYRNMTVDASGWLDPRLCEATGRTGLRWVYGTNHPDAEGPSYWIRECSRETRSYESGSGTFVAAGVAVDEWLPPSPKHPEIEEYVAQGLRAARKADPELFIAVWVTDVRPALTDLVEDGVVDLVIVEGYTHTAERYGPDAWLAWPTCLRRCDLAKSAGILKKTIFSFGHVTDEPNAKGDRLDPDWLTEKAREIKRLYPEMPGVAYFQSDAPDTRGLRKLVRHCDRLSGELWPS